MLNNGSESASASASGTGQKQPVDYGAGHKIKISSLLKKSTEKQRERERRQELEALGRGVNPGAQPSPQRSVRWALNAEQLTATEDESSDAKVDSRQDTLQLGTEIQIELNNADTSDREHRQRAQMAMYERMR